MIYKLFTNLLNPTVLAFLNGISKAQPLRMILTFAMIVGITSRFGTAGDWPQLLGPNRDGQAAAETKLNAHWNPSLFSNPIWQVNAGSGYAGPVVAQNKAFLLHRQNRSEILQAVDIETGKPLWQASWNSSYQSTMNPDSGPRATPVVSDGRVVCYGAAGDLTSVDVNSGKLLWHSSLRKDYQADDGYFGAGSTPLIVSGVIIVNIGGKSAGIVGVDLKSGTVTWTATNYDASYSSPIALTASGKQCALVVTRLNAVLLDVKTGKVLSEKQFGSRGPTVNAASPIRVADGKYFITASYGVGATLLDVSSTAMTELYRASEVLSSQYNSPVLIGQRLIGIDGREDIGQASLRALDPLSRKVIWEQPGFGMAHLIAIGNHVLSVGVSGNVRLIDGAANVYTELAAGSLRSGIYRALPALAGNQLIVRCSNDGDSTEFLAFRLPTVP